MWPHGSLSEYTFLKKPFPEAPPKEPHSPPLPITAPAASFPGPSAGACSADLVCSFSMRFNYDIGATAWGLYPVTSSFQTSVWCLIPIVNRKWMLIDTCTRSFTLASQTKLSMCQDGGTGFHPITIKKKVRRFDYHHLVNMWCYIWGQRYFHFKVMRKRFWRWGQWEGYRDLIFL